MLTLEHQSRPQIRKWGVMHTYWIDFARTGNLKFSGILVGKTVIRIPRDQTNSCCFATYITEGMQSFAEGKNNLFQKNCCSRYERNTINQLRRWSSAGSRKEVLSQFLNRYAKKDLPALKTKIDSIQKYVIVFIAFPTWGMKLPPKTFLKQNDYGGKTVIPFNTNGGYGIGSSFQTVSDMCPDSNVSEEFNIRGGSERDGPLLVIKGKKAEEVKRVKKWLQKLKMVKEAE